MIVGGAAGGVAQPHRAGEDLRRQLFGFLPGGRLARTIEGAVAGEGELAAGMAGAFIDHGANGMAVTARLPAAQHHFGDGLLPGCLRRGLRNRALRPGSDVRPSVRPKSCPVPDRRGDRGHRQRRGAISHGRADGGAGRGQNNGQSGKQNAVGTRSIGTGHLFHLATGAIRPPLSCTGRALAISGCLARKGALTGVNATPRQGTGSRSGPPKIITGRAIVRFWRSAFSLCEGGFQALARPSFDRPRGRPHCPPQLDG